MDVKWSIVSKALLKSMIIPRTCFLMPSSIILTENYLQLVLVVNILTNTLRGSFNMPTA